MRARWTMKALRRLLGGLITEDRRHRGASPDRPDSSRRAFMAGVGALSAGTLLACRGAPLRSLSAAMAPRIAILGAGMAGLMACDTLRKAGLSATVFEARTRVGGRVLSDRRFHPADPTRRAVELGGEFIDSDHTLMLSLAQEFGLAVFDSTTAPELDETYWFGGQRHTEATILAEFMPIARAIMTAGEEIGIPVEDRKSVV